MSVSRTEHKQLHLDFGSRNKCGSFFSFWCRMLRSKKDKTSEQSPDLWKMCRVFLSSKTPWTANPRPRPARKTSTSRLLGKHPKARGEPPWFIETVVSCFCGWARDQAVGCSSRPRLLPMGAPLRPDVFSCSRIYPESPVVTHFTIMVESVVDGLTSNGAIMGQSILLGSYIAFQQKVDLICCSVKSVVKQG